MNRWMMLIVLLVPNLIQAQSALKQELDTLLSHNQQADNIGLIIQDAEDGHILYSHRAHCPATPASNLKLFTAAAALWKLGPDYRFSTRAYAPAKRAEVDSLTIEFTGDPSLTHQQLDQLIRQVKRQGIQQVKREVIVVADRAERPYYAPGWSIDDINWYYSPPITPIIVDENSATLTLSPSQQLGGGVEAKVNTPVPLTIDNHLITVSQQDAKKSCYLLMKMKHDNSIELKGCWSINKHASEKIAIQHPSHYVRALLYQSFKRHHIRVNKITFGAKPKANKLIAEIKSPTVLQLVGVMLKDSNNLYADSLLKTLGYEQYGHGNFKLGAQALIETVQAKSDIDFSHSVIIDGAGGSRYNLVSAKQLSRLLYVMYHDSYYKYFLAALPDAGKQGTLKSRMQSFDLVGRVFAKTGSMSGVSNLSGYLITKQGKTLIFSIMINHIISTPDDWRDIYQARQLQAEIASIMSRYQA